MTAPLAGSMSRGNIGSEIKWALSFHRELVKDCDQKWQQNQKKPKSLVAPPTYLEEVYNADSCDNMKKKTVPRAVKEYSPLHMIFFIASKSVVKLPMTG